MLDTNVLSETVKLEGNPQVLSWLAQQEGASLFISSITVGEIAQGVAKLGDTRRARDLERWLEHQLAHTFAGRVLMPDTEVMRRWGKLTGPLLAIGRPVSAFDSVLAATALELNLTLVTRNLKDVEGMGVTTLNPWTPQNI